LSQLNSLRDVPRGLPDLTFIMRLLNINADGSFSLTWFASARVPRYAILSHRWEADNQEVTLQDIRNGSTNGKTGYRKIQFCGDQAKRHGLQYFWVDSCCIDQSSSAELSEAINSMFRWYQNSAKCYVYLSDVSSGKRSLSSELLWKLAFRQSQWFTRGWTLQELLAPASVEFFSRDAKWLGDKRSLENEIQQTTGIAIQALQGVSVLQFSIQERMSWTKNRETTREEDQAYCLMGIFDVHIPVIYGEGKNSAYKRLREVIDKQSEELKCLQALRTSNYEQFKDRNPGRLEGTCKWFLQHERFLDWQQSSSGLLWVSADPGCGKSVLAKSLIDEEIKSTASRTTCYFFFKDDNDKQKSLTSALSSLLHQLFLQKQSLIQYAMHDYKIEGDHLVHLFYKLWGILMKAASDSKAGEVVCVLDGLDECAEAERYQIIDTLSTYYKQSGNQLKFLITSRPYYDIERKFANLIRRFPTIRLRGERESETIGHEIDIVIRSTVLELGEELGLDDSEQSILRDELLAMENRTYLWLKLIVDVIREEIDTSKSRLKRIVHTLPVTVDQAYEAILSKSKDQRRARKLLRIIVVARRPLTIQEMNIALAIEDHHRSYEDLGLDVQDEARAAATLRNLCGLFVNIINKKIYLIHQTAKEFLLTKDQLLQGGWKHSVSLEKSELLMARICTTYLMFTVFTKPSYEYTFNHARANGNSRGIKGRRDLAVELHLKKHGYYNYAASFWTIHYKAAQSKIPDVILQSAIALYDTRSHRFYNWATESSMDRTLLSSSNIMVATYFGHETVVEALLDSGAEIESKDENGQTPLLLAANDGHETVVKVLIEANAETESKDKDGQTPLSRAAEKGHETIVKMLIEAKADVKSKDMGSRTPLCWAAMKGCKAVVETLLKVNAEIESRDSCGQTSLSKAAEQGHDTIVQILLEANADVESRDMRSRTPLYQAARKGRKAVVEALLKVNAEIESRDSCGQTSLSQAAERGHEAIVKMLLEAKADIESRDRWGRTPLWWAATQKSEAVVKTLLKANAEIESKDKSGRTSLSRAAEGGKEDVVKLLLKADAQIESTDKNGQTPLSWAAEKGKSVVVKILIDAEASVNSKDIWGRTPLLRAAENRHEAVVEILLKANADAVYIVDWEQKLLLLEAVKEGHKTLVKMLLTGKADVESRDKWDRTPLDYAIEKRHDVIVKMILEADADVESKDAWGRTPILRAVETEHEASVKMLIKAEADINSKDMWDRTPLSRAVEKGYKGIVKILLEANAVVDVKDKWNRTPLSRAAEKGYEGIVKILLEANAVVDVKDKWNQTPLLRAIEKGHEAVVALLIAKLT
jgi:ankyrin repeat protein